jgi:hypothetical protein
VQALRRRFPEAPAWGQADFQEKGIITNLNSKRNSRRRRKEEEEILKYGPVDEVKEIRRSKRERKQSHRFNGPDWTN